MSCSVFERVPDNKKEPGGCKLRGSSSTNVATPTKSKTTLRSRFTVKANCSRSTSLQSRTKQCCLCWCCCCISCSCSDANKRNIAKGNAPIKKPTNTDIHTCDEDPPPTLEEIKEWGVSFDKLMTSKAGRKVFRDFLRCEYSEENILFWLACEELKTETCPEQIQEKVQTIYDTYISVLSPTEVSLDSRVREIVNNNLDNPNPHIYEEAQLQIYTLMQRDSYPRFVNSSNYKSLLEQSEPDAIQTVTIETVEPQESTVKSD